MENNTDKNIKGRKEPNAVEAEEAVLGCMLINSNSVPKAMQTLDKDDLSGCFMWPCGLGTVACAPVACGRDLASPSCALAPLHRTPGLLFAVVSSLVAAAPVYMLAAWRWSVEWPSGELSND